MDPFARAQNNAFVSHAVDRAHTRRLDATWLADSQSSPSTRYVVVWQDEILLENEGDFADASPDQGALLHLQHFSQSELVELQQQCPGQPSDVVLLGTLGGVTYFAVGIGDTCDVLGRGLGNGGQFLDLRGAATRLSHEEGALAAQAKAMVHWHRQHRFCGHCGSPMQSEEGAISFGAPTRHAGRCISRGSILRSLCWCSGASAAFWAGNRVGPRHDIRMSRDMWSRARAWRPLWHAKSRRKRAS